MNPTDLERAIMDFLLGGDHPVLAVLRSQWAQARVTGRELTRVGFFLKMHVPPSARLATTKRLFTLGDDVVIDLPGRETIAGVVLFVRNGILDLLELYTFDSPWPIDTSGFVVRYSREPHDLSVLDNVV